MRYHVKVFLSSKQKGFTDEREDLPKAITSLNEELENQEIPIKLDVVTLETDHEGNITVNELIEKRIKESNIYVGFVGKEYREIVEKEYDLAKKTGLKIFFYILK